MIVFNLACDRGHVFEGWFASAEDFDAQNARGVVRCPICDGARIEKRLSAPRLNLNGGAAPEPPAQDAPAVSASQQGAWLQAVRHLIESTENVGERFADEARRIHYDEAPARSIRGTATSDQARELAEEGIDVLSLPLPVAFKKPWQ